MLFHYPARLIAEVEVKVTKELKSRIKLYVQLVYNLKSKPSLKTLKALFPKYSDLRVSLNWLHILRITEDKDMAENTEEFRVESQQPESAFNLKELVEQKTQELDSAIFTFSRTGLISKGLLEYVAGSSISYFIFANYQGGRERIGTVGYSLTHQSFYFCYRNGRCIYTQKCTTSAIALISRERRLKNSFTKHGLI